MKYEVHISPAPGVVIPFETVHVDDYSLRARRSIFLRTSDKASAERAVRVINDTARRSDDNVPWIREVADAQ